MNRQAEFHWGKKSKWPTQKQVIFQLRQFSIIFSKISWVGPWVNRIDARALMWLNLYGHEAV